jgi:REP element-mobilizing transposase RayT
MHVHLVFVTKYRPEVFTKEILVDLRNIFAGVCNDFKSELVEFDGEHDHVHLLVNYHPKVAVSNLVNSLKGVSSRRSGPLAGRSILIRDSVCSNLSSSLVGKRRHDRIDPGYDCFCERGHVMDVLGLFLFKDVISLGASLYLVSYFGRWAIVRENKSR